MMPMDTQTPRTPTFSEQLAILVKAVRTAMGWSQADFAQLTGVSRPTLQRLEQKDPTALRSDSLDKILSTLYEQGVRYELMPDRLSIHFDQQALNKAIAQLNQAKRPPRAQQLGRDNKH